MRVFREQVLVEDIEESIPSRLCMVDCRFEEIIHGADTVFIHFHLLNTNQPQIHRNQSKYIDAIICQIIHLKQEQNRHRNCRNYENKQPITIYLESHSTRREDQRRIHIHQWQTRSNDTKERLNLRQC